MAHSLSPLAGSRWRFAAHLGIAPGGSPLLAASADADDPVAQILRAAELGFRGITDNGLLARPPATQARMGAALRSVGMAMGSFTFDAAGPQPRFLWGEPIADIAAALAPALAAAERVSGGVVNCVLIDSGGPREEQIARGAGNLAQAAQIARRAGLPLALEPISRARVPQALVETGREAMDLIHMSGSPHLGLILDSCHCHCKGEDIATLISACADRLRAIQIADMPGRVEPGAGTIDFAPFMAALEQIRWSGLIEAELTPAAGAGAGEAAMLAALARL